MTVQEKLQYLDSLYEQNKITEAEEFLLAQTADDNFENSLQVKISLNNELMGIYRNKGNKEKCMERVEKQKAWMEQAADTLDPASLATLYLNIANAYQAFGMLTESYDILNEVELMYNKILEKNDFRLASLYNNKAVLLIKMKDLDQAEVYFKMALAILKQLREAEDEIAVTYQNLSHIYSTKGKYGLALDMAHKGADLLKQIGAEVSYHYGAICNSIAVIYHTMGDYAKAAEYFDKAADIILKVYGDCKLYQGIRESAALARSQIK